VQAGVNMAVMKPIMDALSTEEMWPFAKPDQKVFLSDVICPCLRSESQPQ
jgi:hypothetical protein